MRTKHTIGGKKLFAPKDYFTREQINAAFSRKAKQHRTGKLTKPILTTNKLITFHEKDEEYSPDNVEGIIDEELQAITNQLENFNIGDFMLN